MAAAIIRLALLLSGVCLAVGAGLLGHQECTYGPSYWCGSIQNAKQCSAVSHCISSVWEQMELPADNDGVCDVCKDIVRQARNILNSNQTEEELKQVFDLSCRLIPLPDVASECVQMADEFIPELLETLASQMNPQIVCATAGLCNSVRIDRLLREHNLLDWHPKQPKTTDPDPKDCHDCQTFVQDTINLVQEHSKQELMDHLLAICSALGSVSDGCSALVTVNIDVIYDFLANQLDSKSLCELFGMCGDMFSAVSRPAVPASGDEACDFCVAIAQHWRDVLAANSTEEEFKEILDGICHQTGQFSSECSALVDTYYKQVYALLISDFDPKQVCEVVGICADIKNQAQWTVFHTNEMPADQILGETNEIFMLGGWTGADESNSIRVQQQQPQMLPRVKLQSSVKISVSGLSGVRVGGDQACTMCEFTLHFIQVQLQDKATKEEIEQAVKGVCKYLPQDLSEQCDDYVDAYGDQVIALLQQEIDPSVLCPMLGLCPSNMTTDHHAVADGNSGVRGDVTCVACEYIMVQLKELLANKTYQAAVRDALDKVCTVMPAAVSDECQTFVDQNAVEVMELLVAGIVPEQICRMLHFCKDNMGSLPPLDASHQLPLTRMFGPILPEIPAASSFESRGQTKACVVCEFALATLEKLVLDNNTHIESEIRQVVDQVCLLLPATVQEDCLGFVEQYSDAIVALIINDISPKAVCKDLHICKPASFEGVFGGAAVVKMHSVTKRSAAASTPSDMDCLMCRALYNVVKNTADPEAAAREFCDTVDVGTVEDCQRIIPVVLSTELESSSTTTCVKADLCPRPSNLIGSQQCTWGPAYWCQSVVHATSCGAIEHCQTSQWMAASPAA